MKEDTLDYREFSRLMRDWTRPLPWALRRDMVRDLTLDVDQAQLADRISQIIAATLKLRNGEGVEDETFERVRRVLMEGELRQTRAAMVLALALQPGEKEQDA